PGCPRQGEGWRARPRRGPQLYDTPYEEWETAGEGPGVPTTRESRLPRDDERPADEYDQPWEWKKDHISRAFAGDSIPRGAGCHPGVPQPHGPQHPWVPPQGPPAPHPPVSVGTTPGPSIPQHPWVPGCHVPLCRWYHGPIGRAGAETLLALCREGSFLVRDCETSPDDYSLSLRSSHGFVHVKLTRTREQHFMLGRAGAAFPSVPEAVRHYTARALPVRGARHLSLLYPVAVQPL
ncbi:SHF protein, partial [Anhinga anhinga]|nr:SHF protein [Anhinga anhinga]